MRTLGHTCTGGCICTIQEEEGEEEEGTVGVNPACPVSGHSADVRAVSFSPDGQRVVSGACDGLVMIWDTAT